MRMWRTFFAFSILMFLGDSHFRIILPGFVLVTDSVRITNKVFMFLLLCVRSRVMLVFEFHIRCLFSGINLMTTRATFESCLLIRPWFITNQHERRKKHGKNNSFGCMLTCTRQIEFRAKFSSVKRVDRNEHTEKVFFQCLARKKKQITVEKKKNTSKNTREKNTDTAQCDLETNYVIRWIENN